MNEVNRVQMTLEMVAVYIQGGQIVVFFIGEFDNYGRRKL